MDIYAVYVQVHFYNAQTQSTQRPSDSTDGEVLHSMHVYSTPNGPVMRVIAHDEVQKADNV